MDRNQLADTLLRLSGVGFGYDLTPEDREAMRQAAQVLVGTKSGEGQTDG